MNDLEIEMQSTKEPITQEASGGPLQSAGTQRTVLDTDDELVFPKHKRVITQYSTGASGTVELHLYYGEKEISFDEPGLFAFGEKLAKQSRFVAGSATTWGEGYDLLGRTPPTRPFTAADIDIYNQIHHSGARLPDLVDELEEMLELRIAVTQDSIEISDRSSACGHPLNEFGQHGVGQSTCDGHGVIKGKYHEG